MARPKKENADYHTHDKEMRNDPKIRAVRKRYRHEGYSVYNMMLEVLTGSNNWQIEWNDTTIELLSGDFDSDNLQEIIEYCAGKLKLFTIEDGYLFSYQHQKRFNPLLAKRKRDNKPVIASENPHSKVKYSKVEESKGEGLSNTVHPPEIFFKNENGQSEKGLPGAKFSPPQFNQVSDFFWQKLKNTWDGSKVNLGAQKFFNHYQSLGWKTATGAQVQDWEAMANTWILEDLEDARKKKTNVPRDTTPKPQQPDESKTIAFVESIYNEFKAGTIKEPGLPADLYSFLVDKNKLVLSPEEHGNILTQCNGDGQLAKKKALSKYFTSLITKQNATVF